MERTKQNNTITWIKVFIKGVFLCNAIEFSIIPCSEIVRLCCVYKSVTNIWQEYSSKGLFVFFSFMVIICRNQLSKQASHCSKATQTLLVKSKCELKEMSKTWSKVYKKYKTNQRFFYFTPVSLLRPHLDTACTSLSVDCRIKSCQKPV